VNKSTCAAKLDCLMLDYANVILGWSTEAHVVVGTGLIRDLVILGSGMNSRDLSLGGHGSDREGEREAIKSEVEGGTM